MRYVKENMPHEYYFEKNSQFDLYGKFKSNGHKLMIDQRHCGRYRALFVNFILLDKDNKRVKLKDMNSEWSSYKEMNEDLKELRKKFGAFTFYKKAHHVNDKNNNQVK